MTQADLYDTNKTGRNAPGTDGTNERVQVVSFGCRLNHAESDTIREAVGKTGRSDVIVVNTCAVTKEAQRQARQSIRQLRRQNGNAELIVTGCAAQIDPKAFAKMSEVDTVIGNREKLHASTFARNAPHANVSVQNIFDAAPTSSTGPIASRARSRSFVQIQTGCDHRCTFCVIPYGRGNSVSRQPEDILKTIRQLIDAGQQEIVLTGVDLTSYGADLEDRPSLGDLVETVLERCPTLPRLRLSSIDSIEVDEKLLDYVTGHDRLMPHLHLSLQSGDPLILKRMKRRHTPTEAIEFCHTVRERRPEIRFGADFIAGFPTETDEMFENTLSHIKNCGLTYLHVFPYSAHEQTPASRMPQVPPTVIKQRAARLRHLGETQLKRHLAAKIGTHDEILVEQNGRAHGRDFTAYRLNTDVLPGTIATVRTIHTTPTHAVAEPIQQEA